MNDAEKAKFHRDAEAWAKNDADNDQRRADILTARSLIGKFAGTEGFGLALQNVAQAIQDARAEGARRQELAPLAARIAKGRTKYANGCTVLSLLDEAGEVAHAVNKYETADRVREELLDVAAVAMRLYFGEVDRGLEIDGLTQRRTDSATKVGGGT